MASMPDIEEWLENANEALAVSLVSPSSSGLRSVATFHPKFTYAIFGDDEKIFGYKDLKVGLRFRANDMRPHLHTSYSKKLKPPAGVDEPTDVAAVLAEGGHLPKVAFVKGSDFENSSKQLGDNWTPPGTLHATIDGTDGRYEIWKGSLADPAIKQLNSRVQILVPLFIEGGTYIGQSADSDSSELDLSDADRWTVFFLYKTQTSSEDPEKTSYVFVGYATVYRFFYFQRHTPPPSPKDSWELPQGNYDLAELPCRTRLSQFVILPPFQGKGNGARLYKTIFESYHAHPQTHEFTVENPSETFDDLRDICDLTFLRTIPEFNALGLDTSVSIPESGAVPPLVVGGDALERIRRKAKIAPRQFARVVEMHLMSKLPASVRPTLDLDALVPAPTKADKHQERIWQLIVKQRLYRHNRDVLSQIEPSERIEKLRETLTSVELEYARLLAAHDRAAKHSTALPQPQANGKRKLDETGGEPPSKKGRTESA
ncbi:histone acetyltransferase type B catalytic subunit [Hirsutella rhossiliensis]|uniref:Histone acetyltransferase type B catalytic subunit n=1 Tax=Hirsutella rhossiliensis TaxID=111463 RepID=A0A9P8SLB8_9HYPO|nr:histone acetyltransferase type B catalytic subunit [Hirsutella rhossiliensis]KAH0966796.1 histone acetyltransferase type B catalytic subunit [Hirsutella rhossiliensis]